VAADRRKLHNQELRDFYGSPNIIRAIKSRRMKWTGHVAHLSQRTNLSWRQQFNPEDGGSTVLRNVDIQLPQHTAQQPRKPRTRYKRMYFKETICEGVD